MLEFLTAILAFAAIMILLSTLVTVIVETVQKSLRMRRAGFQQMLEGLYESALRDLLNKDLEKKPSSEIAKAKKGANLRQATRNVAQKFAADSDSSIKASMMKAAKEAENMSAQEGVEHVAKKVAGATFAESIMRNPNFDWVTTHSWFGRAMLWLRRRLVTTDFESLDTREFIEQLANTEAGAKLARLKEPELGQLLRTIAYQFERYGEAASDYFARRAWVISVFVALALAFVVNVDAVRVFRTLVLKPTVAQELVNAMDALEKAKQEQPQKAGEQSQKAEDQPSKADEPTQEADSQSQKAEEQSQEAEEQQAAEAPETTPDQDDDAQLKTMRDTMDQVNEQLAKLSAQGVPVGRAYFPFCSAYLEILERKGKQANSIKANAEPAIDMEICQEVPKMQHTYAQEHKDQWLGTYWGSAVDWLVYEAKWVKWIFTHTNGWGWFFSTLLAGGLIGLGAPFWYDLYRKAALVLPVAQVASRFVSVGRKTVAASPPEDEVAARPAAAGAKADQQPQSIRRSERATIAPADLCDAFTRARSGPPSPPKPRRKSAPKKSTTRKMAAKKT